MINWNQNRQKSKAKFKQRSHCTPQCVECKCCVLFGWLWQDKIKQNNSDCKRNWRGKEKKGKERGVAAREGWARLWPLLWCTGIYEFDLTWVASSPPICHQVNVYHMLVLMVLWWQLNFPWGLSLRVTLFIATAGKYIVIRMWNWPSLNYGSSLPLRGEVKLYKMQLCGAHI